ncbi:IclR family transcriptional regulator [Falsochrobactrum shanghaiense]|uniref:IclR family transcriptional regulator n=1 Tax=Falsochrobactrum shanghaiense TaxID=2201899 RepID=A0A316JB73_9HYPH|nr:IclR family transcriptional regulator [Falsochrobactrum shanghaiense]PWL18606.1 IclR family transcriptional regulator [Falsochrobactrum shanghaiense]
MSDEEAGPSGRQEVPGTASFSRFMRVLQAVSDSEAPLTTARLAILVGLPRPTVYRIVAALKAEGMLTEEAQTGAWLLGPRLVSLAARSWDRSDLRKAAQIPLAQLRDQLDETIHLAIRSGDEMVYIDKIESNRTVRMMSRVGTCVPLHSSSVGKAWLASLDDVEMRAILAQLPLRPRTKHTLTTREAVAAEIAATRERGYSLDLQENEEDICCYGRAIPDQNGRARGCISVSMPRYRFEEAPSGPITQAMEQCVRAIAQQMISMDG